MKTIALAVSISLTLFACLEERRQEIVASVVKDTIPDTITEREIIAEKSAIELNMERLGLVDIRTLDSSIQVDLRYSSENNFTGRDMYGLLNRCYLQKDVAMKVVRAQELLRKQFPYYSLLVFDGARPVSIQRYMWDSVNLNPHDRQKYLSNPNNKSLHNYGAAVDLTIVDDLGNELDMGTPYDFFGELAHPAKEGQSYSEGKLSVQQITNRELLRTTMRAGGFSGIQTEWWHFNSCSRIRASEIYTVIE